MCIRDSTKAGTVTDTKKVAEALRSLPVEDKYLGEGRWSGQAFFGINQEMSFPSGIGMMVDGKLLPVQRAEASGE